MRDATLEPQISLAIELVLQMMRECFVGGFVTGASGRAVACSSYCLPVDYHRVPLASVYSDGTGLPLEQIREEQRARLALRTGTAEPAAGISK